jgi:hypothetical protein
MNSEDLYIGEYKQSERMRNNCRGAASFYCFLALCISIALIFILFIYFSAYYVFEPDPSIITTLPPRAIIIKKYPDFYYERKDSSGNTYYEGVVGTTKINIYIGNITVKKKEKPELSRKR